MSQGLQVWDANGNIMLDTSNRVFKGVIIQSVVETGSPTVSFSGTDSTSTVLIEALSNGDGSPVPTITPITGGATIAWGADARGSGFTRDILIMEF
jgi:hypothetical protein